MKKIWINSCLSYSMGGLMYGDKAILVYVGPAKILDCSDRPGAEPPYIRIFFPFEIARKRDAGDNIDYLPSFPATIDEYREWVDSGLISESNG